MNKYALQITTLIFLAIAVFFDSDDLPYGFFTILHFVVCSYFGYKVYLYYLKEKNISFMFCLLALFAITYNPFVKAKFDSGEWLLINILTIAFIIYTEFLSLQILKKCGAYLFNIAKILVIPAIIICIIYNVVNKEIKKQERIEQARIYKEEQNQLFADLGFYTAIFEYIPERCKKAGYEQDIINNIKKDYQPEITLLFNKARMHFQNGKNLLEIYQELPTEKIEQAAQKGWSQARTAAIIKNILEKHKDNPKEFENIMMDLLNTGNIDESAEIYHTNPNNFEVVLLNLLKTVDTSKYNNLVTDKDICIVMEDLFKSDYKTFISFLEKYNIDYKKHNPLLLRSGAKWVIEQHN